MYKNLIMHNWDSCPIHVFFFIYNCNHYIYEYVKILKYCVRAIYLVINGLHVLKEHKQFILFFNLQQHYWHKWEKGCSWVPLFLTFSTYGSNSRNNVSLDWNWHFQSRSEWTCIQPHLYITLQVTLQPWVWKRTNLESRPTTLACAWTVM